MRRGSKSLHQLEQHHLLQQSPANRFNATIQGRAHQYEWYVEEGVPPVTEVSTTHAYVEPGSYHIILSASNHDTHVAVTTTLHITDGFTTFVASAGRHLPPFTNWITAATNIQDAISENILPGGVVLVSNGVYDSGCVNIFGTSNRIAITNPITVRSANGRENTTLRGKGPRGDDAIRCAYIGNDARLEGFTLTGGHTRNRFTILGELYGSGGGAWCAPEAYITDCLIISNEALHSAGGVFRGTLSNCTITANYGHNYGGGLRWVHAKRCRITENASARGGGAHQRSLRNCLIHDNRAGVHGGGVFEGRVENCTITQNSASQGGGTRGSEVLNSIVYFNTGTIFSTHDVVLSTNGSCDFTCTSRDPGGSNNITAVPQFVGTASGDYRVRATSPCIDTGVNQAWMRGALAWDGEPRIRNGTADQGAHEFAFTAQIRVLLEGAFMHESNTMRTTLREQHLVPTRAPYAADERSVPAIPSNAVDWILVQLRASNNAPASASQSAFIDPDGYLLSDSGHKGIRIEATPTNYYLVVKHRNHAAAMSAQPIDFTNRMVEVDFAVGTNTHFGEATGVANLNGGRWGLVAGDADGDGWISAADAALHTSQLGRTYLNVIGSDEVARAGKAIIVAGGKRLDDPVWRATDTIADKAYRVLTYRGFSKANIRYHSFDPDQEDDVDGNGRVDDIYADSRRPRVEATFTGGWVDGTTDKLFVYLADHGSRNADSGYFHMHVGEDDLLSGTTLNLWLDELQGAHTALTLTVVADFCYAGRFIDALTNTPYADRRTVIAATGRDELTYFRNSVSFPKESRLTQRGFDERVILVAGATADQAIPSIAHHVYQTLLSRRFDHEHIFFLSNNADDGPIDQPPVDASAERAQLEYAITQWAHTNKTDRLTVYLIGSGADNRFQINATEQLEAQHLDTWLDVLQTYNRTVHAVLDFSGAGAFITALDPPENMERTVIASSAAGRRSVLEPDLSFSAFFARALFDGHTLGSAVNLARRTIRRASGSLRQKVLVEANGNQVPNEKNMDAALAELRYIGPAFLTGEDAPHIGALDLPTVLTNTTSALLAVDEVTDVDGIAQVWCSITTPTNHPGQIAITVPLQQQTSARWERAYDGFTDPGLYTLTFFAEDTLGNRSVGIQASILQTNTQVFVEVNPIQPDPFEPDPTYTDALVGHLPAVQMRTLHTADDEDWFAFYALSNYLYDIETVHLSGQIDTVIDLASMVNQFGCEPEASPDKYDEPGRSVGVWKALFFTLFLGS